MRLVRIARQMPSLIAPQGWLLQCMSPVSADTSGSAKSFVNGQERKDGGQHAGYQCRIAQTSEIDNRRRRGWGTCGRTTSGA
jgi:hypothetical protein